LERRDKQDCSNLIADVVVLGLRYKTLKPAVMMLSSSISSSASSSLSKCQYYR